MHRGSLRIPTIANEISKTLQAERIRGNLTPHKLGLRIGSTHSTIYAVEKDCQFKRLDTIIAIADELGFELKLVPKEKK
jgi:DNA-binding XRE family transcriptional regulator